MTKTLVIALVAIAAFAVVLVLAVKSTNPREDETAPGMDAGPQPRQVVSQGPITPYPQASEVALYLAGGVDGAGAPELTHRLTLEERQAFEATLIRKTYDRPAEAVLACGKPRHFFRYLDGTGQVVGAVSVDFCSACVGFEPDLAASEGETEFLYDDLRALVEAMGAPTQLTCGG